jgi:hypothetical protein
MMPAPCAYIKFNYQLIPVINCVNSRIWSFADDIYKVPVSYSDVVQTILR